MNSSMQENKVINVKSLILYPFYNWKRILISAFLIFLLGCILLSLTYYRAYCAKKMGIVKHDKAFLEMQEYLDKKEYLESRFEFLEDTIDSQQDYLKQSVLIQIDPYKAWRAEYSFYVDTNYKIMPEMVYQDPDKTPVIVNTLSNFLKSDDLKLKIGEALNIDSLQVDELYQVTTGSKNSVLVRATADTETRVSTIMDLVKEELSKEEKRFYNSFGKFSVIPTLDSCYMTVDQNLLNYQNTLFSSLKENQKEMVTIKGEMEKLSEPSDTFHQTVKKVFFVMVVSLILPYGFYCVKFVCSDRVYDSERLEWQWQIKVLGILALNHKHNALENWVSRLDGRADIHDVNAYAVTARNIFNCSGDKKNLLVAGDAPEEVCQLVRSKLQENLPEVKLNYFGSFLNNAESASALGKCEGVVLIEQCGVSKGTNICNEIKQIQDLGKDLVGCVVVDL